MVSVHYSDRRSKLLFEDADRLPGSMSWRHKARGQRKAAGAKGGAAKRKHKGDDLLSGDSGPEKRAKTSASTPAADLPIDSNMDEEIAVTDTYPGTNDGANANVTTMYNPI